MPKRPKTPPPPEDEPRYLVIVHPYPLNANLLLHADRRTLALWLACCTGKDALYAMFYKPASPGMVIIEVDRYFERFDSLLGKHIWSSFLKYPTEEDRDKASKVFWCHYNSGRMVQKNGWKRVDVEEHWFHGWSPNNDMIKHPYPKTTYCDVPAEAQTGVPLCRPLPKDNFTPPPPRPRPTVGSAEWIHSRSSNASEAPSSSRRRRGNHGSQLSPSDSASMISSPTGIGARAPPPQRTLVSQWLAKQHANEPVWPRAPSTISSSFTLSSSTVSSSVGSRTPSALGATPAAAPPPSRPSVPSLGPYESSDWADEVEIQLDDVPTSPQSGASTRRAPGGRTATPRRAPEPEGAIDPEQDYEYEEEDLPKRSTADAMKDIFDGAPRVAAPVGNGAGLHDLEEEDEEEPNYLEWNYPQAVRTTTRDWTPATGEDEDNIENTWDGYDAPRWEHPTRVSIKGGEKWICPEHGPTCNPGICKARARVEAERRWQKEHDERQEAKMKRQEKSKKAAEKRERKLAQAEGREVSHDLPPHFPSHRYGGAGSSSSDSDSEGSSSDSPAGSESHSPPPLSPQENAAGAESRAEEGSLWDDGERVDPKVSLPSNRSVTGSNRVEGEDEARSVGGPRTASSTSNPNSNNNHATRQQPTGVARSADASERPQLVRPGDDPPATAQSPPGLRQSVRGTRGATRLPATTTSARGTSSQRPAPGLSKSVSNTSSTASAWTAPSSSTRDDGSTGPDADAAPPPWSRQGNGRQRDRGRSQSTGASSSTLSDHRPTGGPGAIATSQSSSVSSGPRSPAGMSRVPTSPPGLFRPVDGGFPTFADTTWGDPIAVAQLASRKSSNSTSGTRSPASRSAVGADIADGQAGGDNAEAGQEPTAGQNDRTGRGRRGYRRGGRRGSARRTLTAPASSSSMGQDVARPSVLDVTLPPGGPGEQWCNDNVEW